MQSATHTHHSPTDVTAILGATPLFSKVNDTLLQEFSQAALIRNAPKGNILFIKEDPAEYFFLIVHGWIKLFSETIEGSEAVMDMLTNGHMFGETALFDDGHYSYGAECVEPTRYIALPIALLKQAIESHNQMALNLLSSMSRHRRQQDREIEHLNIQNAPQRIGCFLLRLCPAEANSPITLHLPYDKTLIAARLGMKPETFSRALAKLKNEAPIEIHGPTVMLHDIPQLVAYTCNHCSVSFPCEGSVNE